MLFAKISLAPSTSVKTYQELFFRLEAKDYEVGSEFSLHWMAFATRGSFCLLM
jgi:hypothetical protein